MTGGGTHGDSRSKRSRDQERREIEEQLRDADRCGFCGARRDADCGNWSDGISASGTGGACRWDEDVVIRD